MGAPVRIVTVSTRPDKDPVHVYPEALVGGRWTPLDATVAGARPGWAPRRITDRIVWTRKDVGISGYDEDTIEGLGMDFTGTMRRVSVTPGVPDDISHTFADPMRGDPVVSRRRQPGAPYFKVATNADLVQSPAPGNLPYAVPLPIEPEPLPSQNWSSVPRESVAITLNPWPDQVRKWKKEWGAMYPQPNVPEDREMRNINGLGALDFEELSVPEIDELTEAIQFDVTRKVKSGQLPAQAAPQAVSHVVDAVKQGDRSTLQAMPATAKVVRSLSQRGASSVSTPASSPDHPPTRGMIRHNNLRAHASEYGSDDDESLDWMPSLSGARPRPTARGRSAMYNHVHKIVKHRLPQVAHQAGVHPKRIRGLFNPGEARAIKAGQVAGLGALGADPLPIDSMTAANAASAITDGVMRVVDPANATAVSQAVEAGMKAIVGSAPAPAAAQSGLFSSINLGGWGVPVLVIAAITGAAYFMSKPRKAKFRSNPSRRRSSRRGKAGFEKYVPLVLGGVAAYMILKPKTAAPGGVQPAQQGLFSNLLNMFKSGPTSTQQAAGMVQAASNPFTSMINTIFGAPKPATPTTTTSIKPTSTQPLNIVTESEVYGGSSSPSPVPGMVTSIEDVSPSPSGDSYSSQMVFDA